MPGRMMDSSTQQDLGTKDLGNQGYRGNPSWRQNTTVTGLRSTRSSNSENVAPIGAASSNWRSTGNGHGSGLGGAAQRSPRLGGRQPLTLPSQRSSFAAASSRQQAGPTFGTDITNIAGKAADSKQQLKPLKPLQPAPAQQSEPAPATVPAEVPAVERQLVAQTETNNVQDAEEYVVDINEQLFREEATYQPGADYMTMQTDLTAKMRTILMDWLIEVHMKYKLRSETLHLAVNLIDRYLTVVPVVRKKLQLIGVVAMFIASKFEEINPPELHDWVYITDKAYTKEDVLLMECTMLSTLSFQIVVPTVAHFFEGLQKANACSIVQRDMAAYILELGLLDVRMLQYTPSQKVSAALLLTNQLLARPSAWPQSMVQQSRHRELCPAFSGCVALSRELFFADRDGTGGQLQAVRKKFSTKELNSVATMRL